MRERGGSGSTLARGEKMGGKIRGFQTHSDVVGINIVGGFNVTDQRESHA